MQANHSWCCLNTAKCIPEVRQWWNANVNSLVESTQTGPMQEAVAKKMWWHLLWYSYEGSYSGTLLLPTLLLPLCKSSLPITTENFLHLQQLGSVLSKDYYHFYDTLKYICNNPSTCPQIIGWEQRRLRCDMWRAQTSVFLWFECQY